MSDFTAPEILKAKDLLTEKLSSGPAGGCTSLLQRRLEWGYNRTAAMLYLLETTGFISETDDEGKRRLLTHKATSELDAP